ncbi:MAG: hypothetical protein HN757_08785 [Calditrichaeota bacterium]|nr:hypothetical protein [Calditrichota bacterium]
MLNHTLRIKLYQLLALIFLSLLSSCAITIQALEERVEDHSKLKHVFFLEFNRYGQLRNPYELNHAIDEIGSHNVQADEDSSVNTIDKILVLSFGWNYEKDEAICNYLEFFENYQKQTESDSTIFDNWVIFCVTWDSKSTGIRRTINDIMPGASLADLIAIGPDTILLPLTFWSKAALSDKIGYYDLRHTLEEFITSTPGFEPDRDYGIHLIGHSFGCRIISALSKQKLGFVDIPEPFKFQDHIRGALYIQPSMVEASMPVEENRYPLLVTQNRHDHSGGFLYPFANLFVNAYAYTQTEALYAPALKSREYKTASFFSDLLHIPFTIGWTAVAIPVNFTYAQFHEIKETHINYIPNTLAQLPITEIPVYYLDKLINGKIRGSDYGWGDRNKGLFNLGSINESAGRMSTPIIGDDRKEPTPIIPYEELFVVQNAPIDNGITYVDMSTIRGIGMYGLDYNNPLWDFTIGWLDPIGTHYKHIRDKERFLLMEKVLFGVDD